MLTGYTGQISLGHGAFMAIGGYTTAILMSNQERRSRSSGHTFTSDMRDIWTIPIAGLVAGVVGFLFGFPALRLPGLYLALATFAIAVATPAVVKKFERVHRRRRRDQPLRGSRPAPGRVDHRPVTFEETGSIASSASTIDVQRVALLPLLDDRARHVRRRAGCCCAGASAARSGRCATASSPPPPRASTSPATRRSRSGSAPSTRASPARCSRSRRRSSTRTRSRSRSRSSCSSASSSAGSARSGRSSSARSSSSSCRSMGAARGGVVPDFIPILGDIDTEAPGAPAVVFGVVLILIMLAFPAVRPGSSARSSRSRLAATIGFAKRLEELSTDAQRQTRPLAARARGRDRHRRDRRLERRPGHHRDDDPARRHRAALRPGLRVRRRSRAAPTRTSGT